jgi:tripartite-type tricarboxylate transporter receptor subunit TctC
MATALADPGVREKLSAQGLTPVGNSPEQFRDHIASETAKWAKVIKDASVLTAK